jgi:hypothetical protein
MSTTPTHQAVKAPQSPLERQLIIDYLWTKGYRLENLQTLPADLAKELMTAACTYASLKLAEIEARSKFLLKINYDESL